MRRKFTQKDHGAFSSSWRRVLMSDDLRQMVVLRGAVRKEGISVWRELKMFKVNRCCYCWGINR